MRRRKRTCGSLHEWKLSRSVPGVQCRKVALAMTTVRATAAQTRRGQAVPKADTRASEKVVMSQKEICQVYVQQGQVERRGVEAKSIQVVQGVRGAKEVDPRTSAHTALSQSAGRRLPPGLVLVRTQRPARDDAGAGVLHRQAEDELVLAWAHASRGAGGSPRTATLAATRTP